MMTKYGQAARLLLGTISLLGAACSFAADKPNILIIWGDDIGEYNISAYNLGQMGYRTPNIDSIASQAALPAALHSSPASRLSAPV